ncbi:MAG: HD domain-containing phosphohydrolase, partial [Candidatus Omnitrophota bacterium]
SLVKALEEKDVYTAGHSERVAKYAVDLCMRLNLPEAYIDTVKKAALLHDIGKIAIPDKVLRKKGELTAEEREQMNKHPLEAIRILEPASFLAETHPLILHHHEHYDGRGYPHGLSGERIPLGARIIAIADAYDAMTSGRTYNISKETKDALSTLQSVSGKHFDPNLLEKFIEMIKENTHL